MIEIKIKRIDPIGFTGEDLDRIFHSSPGIIFTQTITKEEFKKLYPEHQSHSQPGSATRNETAKIESDEELTQG